MKIHYSNSVVDRDYDQDGRKRWQVLWQGLDFASATIGEPFMPGEKGRPLLVLCNQADCQITPVTITCYGKKVLRATPTDEAIRNTMGASWRQRLGVEIADGDVCIRVVSHETELERVPVGKKLRMVPGWSGRVVIECNAVGEWLLRTAALVGMGGRLGFGFGRVRIRNREEVPEEAPAGAKGRWFMTPHAVEQYLERSGGSKPALVTVLGRTKEQ